MMKKLLILLLTLTVCSNPMWAQEDATISTRCVTDSEPVNTLDTARQLGIRPITSSIEVHLGSASVRNTYLAPLLYSGPDLGLTYERARRWKNLDWMSLQSLTGQFTMGEDKGAHSENWSGRLRYNYAALYNWDCYFITLMAGPSLGAEAGFDYNLKMASGNNPATAHLAINLGGTLMGAFHYTLFNRHNKAAIQLQLPLLGYALMPEYGASYYETFYLGNTKNQHHFTSLHNQQDFDLRLVTDIPVRAQSSGALRLGLAYHIETMKINQTHTRFSALEAIVGWTLQSIPYNPRKSNVLKYNAYEAY